MINQGCYLPPSNHEVKRYIFRYVSITTLNVMFEILSRRKLYRNTQEYHTNTEYCIINTDYISKKKTYFDLLASLLLLNCCNLG